MRPRRMIVLSLFAALIPGSVLGQSGPDPLEPDAIRAMLDGSGGKDEFPGDHVLTVLHHTDVTVEESGLSHVVDRRVVKVLDAEGVKQTSVLRFDYDPASQFMEVRWVRVFKKNGKIFKLNLDKARDLPQPDHGIRWGARMLIIGVPGLSPGDGVAWESYSKGFQIAYLGPEEAAAASAGDEKYVPPMKGHFYDVVFFEDRVPIAERIYTLHVPSDKPVHAKVVNGEVASEVRPGDGQTHYEWSKRDVPARAEEKREPAPQEFITKVVLATVKTWSEKSVWFFETNEPVFEPDPAIEAKVQEITAGKKTDDEKVEALLRWVAVNIRYSGISMGPGEGYTIHPGTMTFHDRCGVCKDIAGMLITMMRVAGFTVYPAMTMAGAKVEYVAADQFNHCVVAWKQADGTFRMLDPTWAPFSMEEWSTAEGEQHYVVGSPEGEDLTKTPAFGPDLNTFRIEGKSTIGKDGGLGGTVSIQGTGYPDTRMRRSLAYSQAGEGKSVFAKFISAISPFAKVKSYEAGDHADLDEPLVVEMSYEDSWYGAADAGRLSFVIPLAHFILGQERWSPYFMLGSWKERKNPAMLWFPQKVVVEETVKIPKGMEAASLPDPAKADGEWTSWDFSAEQKGATIVWKATWQVKTRLATPESFEELEKLRTTIADYEKAEVVLEAKKPAAAAKEVLP